MLRLKTYVCVKCRKTFKKTVGGVIDKTDMLPICSDCKLGLVSNIFKGTL